MKFTTDNAETIFQDQGFRTMFIAASSGERPAALMYEHSFGSPRSKACRASSAEMGSCGSPYAAISARCHGSQVPLLFARQISELLLTSST